MTIDSSVLIASSALQNSSSLPHSTYFSNPSRIINSLLPKGRLNIDRRRLTLSAKGFIRVHSPCMDTEYLLLKFSSANFRSDLPSICSWKKNKENFLDIIELTISRSNHQATTASLLHRKFSNLLYAFIKT